MAVLAKTACALRYNDVVAFTNACVGASAKLSLWSADAGRR
ncbi:hypothetical protein [Bradyrhizobium japonicum]|nr:hypothetical protein [Bradyrhizobium japonicum]WRJ84713.1 hypothetical protein R3F78_07470 [Bradyrhizobium japonicum]